MDKWLPVRREIRGLWYPGSQVRKRFQEGIINLLNVAERLCKKTENLPFGNVEIIDPHKVVFRVCVWKPDISGLK